jgi:hypothetical protein
MRALLLLFLFACSEDTGGLDGSIRDLGPYDAGSTEDAEPMDADPLDAKEDDVALHDADPMDADPLDADAIDADPSDADPSDADPSDAEPMDADPMDADPPDLGPPDTGAPDIGTPDTGAPDTGVGCNGYGDLCLDNSQCSAGLSCVQSICMPAVVPECGGFVGTPCPANLPSCLYYAGADYGACFTDTERACICAHPLASAVFACP